MFKYFIVISTCLFLVSCQSTKNGYYDNKNTGDLFSTRSLQSNLEFLASDELEGREAATDAEKVASKFIASELKKYGIQTLNGAEDYFQEIKLRKIRFSDKSTFGILNKNNELHEFAYGSNFIGSNRYYTTLDTITSLIFVGYGITAPEYNYDNYADLDVSGKIIIFIPGEPESEDSTFFKGMKKTSFASSWSKIKNAQSQGALGAIYVSAKEKKYGWESIVKYVEKSKLQLVNEPINKKRDSLPILVINDTTLKTLFNQNDISYQVLLDSINAKKSPPAIEFDKKAELHWTFDTTEFVVARNVIGMIKGNDPDLNHESISIGCHYDHEGIGLAGVYNGADDNASGTAAVLEIARVFGLTGDNKRSVIFTFHTAEEKGLLGSKYFTTHFDGMENMIAHINLDMVGRGPEDSIYVIGSDKISTEFHDLVESVNQEGVGMYLDFKFNAPNDPNRFYYRSDHYNFAKQNIPTVFFFDYMQEDYHKVTDDASKINYRKLLNVTRLSYEIARAAANRENRFRSDSIAGN